MSVDWKTWGGKHVFQDSKDHDFFTYPATTMLFLKATHRIKIYHSWLGYPTVKQHKHACQVKTWQATNRWDSLHVSSFPQNTTKRNSLLLLKHCKQQINGTDASNGPRTTPANPNCPTPKTTPRPVSHALASGISA